MDKNTYTSVTADKNVNAVIVEVVEEDKQIKQNTTEPFITESEQGELIQDKANKQCTSADRKG